TAMMSPPHQPGWATCACTWLVRSIETRAPVDQLANGEDSAQSLSVRLNNPSQGGCGVVLLSRAALRAMTFRRDSVLPLLLALTRSSAFVIVAPCGISTRWKRKPK